MFHISKREGGLPYGRGEAAESDMCGLVQTQSASLDGSLDGQGGHTDKTMFRRRRG